MRKRREGNFTNVLNPIRIQILKNKNMTYREIGKLIAKQDDRKMPYTSYACAKALYEYRVGIRTEDGDRNAY